MLWHDVFERKNTFYKSIKNIPTVILGSKNLDFTQKSINSNEYYINLPINRNEDKLFSDEYLQIREKIEGFKKCSKCKIVYCGFGTLSNHNSKEVFNFIKKLISAIHMQKNWVLIVSLGGIKSNLETSDNIFLIDYVPQLDVLTISDVMITHGGHNSVKECLQANVPMLVYPLNNNIDQPGNAVRIYKAGFGLFGKMNKDNPEEILHKLNCVSEMKESVKQENELSDFKRYFSHFHLLF